MAGPRIHELARRKAPLPARGSARWLASEWGIGLLALILAVLVWAVVWGKLADTDTVRVKLDLRTSDGFVAFVAAGDDVLVPLVLKGPKSELEEAITKLGEPATVIVNVPDLERGDTNKWWVDNASQLSLPFPSRLVERPGKTLIEIYRIREIQTQFAQPRTQNVPLGVDCSIELEPESAPVSGPAGKVGTTIEPDPLDLSGLFGDRESGTLPGETRRVLTFEGWRKDPTERRYRKDVVLPEVHAVLRFFLSGRREIAHRIEFKHPEGYEVTTNNPDVELGNYTGLFEGAQEDLDKLENAPDAWWYVVTIPKEKLPAEDEVTEDLEVEFAHKQSLDGLRVKFLEGARLLVVIKKRP